MILFLYFFFNDTATTEIYTLSLHDALPTWTTTGSGAAAAGGAEREATWIMTTPNSAASTTRRTMGRVTRSDMACRRRTHDEPWALASPVSATRRSRTEPTIQNQIAHAAVVSR